MVGRFFLALLVSWVGAVAAEEVVPICYGYGCIAQAKITYSEQQLREIGRQLSVAVDAENERKLLAVAIGELYGWAGQQSDIKNDRGGNYADGHTPGKMDCIDHSQSTTRLLKLLEVRGYLRWHRVLPPEVRSRMFLTVHWSAVIEETHTAGEKSDREAPRFVVDSWFVNNGQPAVILPLAEWKKGAGPDV